MGQIKRMYSGEEIYEDGFLALSNNAKVLFFYCLIVTDDDGMVSGMKSIMRTCEATENDLNELLDSGYLMQVESIYCIRDFKAMNTISGKLYKPTKYQYEYGLLKNVKGRYYLKKEMSKRGELKAYTDVFMTEQQYDRIQNENHFVDDGYREDSE